MNYQLPTTNYQLPTTNYQLPTTNYQLPTRPNFLRYGQASNFPHPSIPSVSGNVCIFATEKNDYGFRDS
ncbi:MAG: hypothetical protein CMC75_11500 [Flavobacteriaceae bacterium]|nr:hypothetical protein [Flavobacteriaceae bacterium]